MLDNLNVVIDQTFVINLPEAKDRYNEYIADFTTMGIVKLEMVEGIRPNGGKTQQDGYVGNRLSHIKCIKLARDRGLKNVLVCEDDARFDVSKLEVMSAVSNDIISFVNSDIDWSHLYFGAGHKDPPIDTSFPHIKLMTKAWSVHCYLVNSKYFDVIIDEMGNTNMSVDKAYYKHYQTLGTCYSVHPRIVYQKEGYSYITKKVEDYRDFHKD